jgi:hypothetical protein
MTNFFNFLRKAATANNTNHSDMDMDTLTISKDEQHDNMQSQETTELSAIPALQTTNTAMEHTPKTFLQLNFVQKGLQDGFAYRNNAALINGKNKIKATFDNLLYTAVQKAKDELYKVKLHEIDTDEISMENTSKLKLQIELITNYAIDLEHERQKAQEGNGLIMAALIGYEQGFTSGLESYQQTESLFALNRQL